MSDHKVSSPSSLTPSNMMAETRMLPTTYTNVFRASGSAEELILDFGLDAHRRGGEGGEAAAMTQRLVLSWGNAKRLAVLLRDLVQLHEQAHGVLALPPPNRAVNPAVVPPTAAANGNIATTPAT